MEDFTDRFSGDPIIGWTTTNYNDRDKNGHVQRMQGFKGFKLDGDRLPADYYDQEMIAVPEGRFHTSIEFFQPTPERAIRYARERMARLRAEADGIEQSIEAVERTAPACQCWNEGQWGRVHREDCSIHKDGA